MTTFEVAEFIGCHEETVRRVYVTGKSSRDRIPSSIYKSPRRRARAGCVSGILRRQDEVRRPMPPA